MPSFNFFKRKMGRKKARAAVGLDCEENDANLANKVQGPKKRNKYQSCQILCEIDKKNELCLNSTVRFIIQKLNMNFRRFSDLKSFFSQFY